VIDINSKDVSPVKWNHVRSTRKVRFSLKSVTKFSRLQRIDTKYFINFFHFSFFSLLEIPKMCEILTEAEHTASAVNFVPPSPSRAQSIRMVSIDTSPIASPDTRFP
jgi:hypothetical protein